MRYHVIWRSEMHNPTNRTPNPKILRHRVSWNPKTRNFENLRVSWNPKTRNFEKFRVSWNPKTWKFENLRVLWNPKTRNFRNLRVSQNPKTRNFPNLRVFQNAETKNPWMRKTRNLNVLIASKINNSTHFVHKRSHYLTCYCVAKYFQSNLVD